ncbi:MAG: phosphoribosylaminoimidazolesuccinocarboxamide synthase [Thermaerobacter sp.]|nr:phosphoribosylaminoimidazolesuccinocarboxamide synthase [Thermaerobacter sp.]
MQKGEFLYEGKAKRIYATEEPNVFWMEFKDDATAGNGQKRGTIGDKGRINAEITQRVFEHLERGGVRTHLLRQESPTVLLVKKLEMFRLEIVVRNIAAGSLVKRIGLEEGREMPEPIVEIYLKDDELGDPLVNDDHVKALGLATEVELAALKAAARKVNDLLRPYFLDRGLLLVDFKLEFGKEDGQIVLGDEVTPDTCRFWDEKTREKLDKDRFRQDLGGVEEAYQEVLRRVDEPHA